MKITLALRTCAKLFSTFLFSGAMFLLSGCASNLIPTDRGETYSFSDLSISYTSEVEADPLLTEAIRKHFKEKLAENLETMLPEKLTGIEPLNLEILISKLYFPQKAKALLFGAFVTEKSSITLSGRDHAGHLVFMVEVETVAPVVAFWSQEKRTANLAKFVAIRAVPRVTFDIKE